MRHVRLTTMVCAAVTATLATACGSTSAAEPPASSVIMVSLATIDRSQAIEAALRQLDAAAERRDHIVVIPVVGTAAGSPPLTLSASDPPDARNDRALERRTREWAETLHDEVAAALRELPQPEPGTTADLAEFVAVGIREAESSSAGGPSTVVVVSSGHTPPDLVDAPIDIARSTSAANPAEVWLVGVGAFAGVDAYVDPAVAERAIARGDAVCEDLADRTCHVVPSLNGIAGGR